MSDDRLNEEPTGVVFRPSYSPTWLNCPGSLRPSINAPDNAGEDAAIGTVFHSLLAEWQLSGRPDYRLGTTELITRDDGTVYEVVINEDMFTYGQDCLDYVRDIFGDRYIEVKVDISDLTPIPGQTGTGDLAICDDGVLDITDWKYGLGVQVFAENNTQLLCYAYGLFKRFDADYDFQTIRMRIAQPRLHHFECWEITREELIEWADYARERARLAWQENAERHPSPKACQWCKVRTNCAAMELAREALADQTFYVLDDPVMGGDVVALMPRPIESVEDVENDIMEGGRPAQMLPNPMELTTEDLSRIYGWRRLMESWFKDIGEELTTRATNGEEVPGWKLVEGRSRRRWRDEDTAAEKLAVLVPSDELFVTKLKSPNQIEPLLRAQGIRGKLMRNYLGTLVEKPQGRPTLAPDGDNRLAIPTDDVFTAEESDEIEL